jgi:hypothetical protein
MRRRIITIYAIACGLFFVAFVTCVLCELHVGVFVSGAGVLVCHLMAKKYYKS